MKRQQRRAFRRDIRERKLHPNHPRGTTMLAKHKWQIKTIAVLERVFEERCSQMAKHGEAMADLPDGTGPDEQWLAPVVDVAQSSYTGPLGAKEIQQIFRDDYMEHRGAEHTGKLGQLTRMHLVREELAEAFELDPDSPEFIDEILQVAALCVQWAEYKLDGEERWGF